MCSVMDVKDSTGELVDDANICQHSSAIWRGTPTTSSRNMGEMK